ncbi:MAG TPA: hypothetical protein VG456_26885 [Candidatus Sulfopaludibacter sp.]|jgi:hypothetical protein|nr:hypothetical protein [Candidatus Sulfopaludibacter sp.]
MAGAPTPFQRILENRLSQLAAETEMLFAETRERARREFADQLNQAARRLFQASGAEELETTLAAAAAPFAATILVFRVDGETARSSKIEIPLASAAALAGAIQTRDPVIAAATPGEVSTPLIELLGHVSDDRAYVFPLVTGESVPALVYACGAVQGPALELLTQIAAAAWTAATPPPAPAPTLVTIVPLPAAPAAPPVAEPVSPWDRLPSEEQQVHLRAQRWARVRIAELRLRKSTAVQAGRSHRNLYEVLKDPVDAARAEFRKTFFAGCPSMVDYLHLELVRTLAHDDADLLGNDYPGPLV